MSITRHREHGPETRTLDRRSSDRHLFYEDPILPDNFEWLSVPNLL